MLLKNNSKRTYVHSKLDEMYRLVLLTLKPSEVKEIPDDVAKGWLKSGEVVEYVDPAKAKEEQAKLLKENEELKKELSKLKDCDDEEVPDREALKKEADELGIKYPKNISTKALYEKVKSHK